MWRAEGRHLHPEFCGRDLQIRSCGQDVLDEGAALIFRPGIVGANESQEIAFGPTPSGSMLSPYPAPRDRSA